MWVSLRTLDMRDPHLDTTSTVIWVMQEGLVSLNVDSASVGINFDLSQSKCCRVADHHNLLKILRRILF